MCPNHTPYFPDNITEYAPWVAEHGLYHPYGKCQCGCEKDAGISHANGTLYGYKKNHPRRFVHGHEIDSICPDMRFGRLLVLCRADQRKDKRRAWKCRCDCGQEITVSADKLKRGHTKSCGCLSRESTIARNTKHGLRQHPLYSTWSGIIQRCTDQNCEAFSDYGKRGIKLCDEWRHNFKEFHDYVSRLPQYGEPGMTLDRINNDGNYEPGNVRWASRRTQRLNSRQTSVHCPPNTP